MIDLAPNHKLGLVAKSPILLAARTIGLGEAIPDGLDPAQLGAIVVGPVRRHPHAGSAPPRLAQAPGQFVLESGLQNRGINATVKRYARHWQRLNTPVVVQLADTEIHYLEETAERLAERTNVGGFELLVPQRIERAGRNQRRGATALIDWLSQAISTLDLCSDLPIWIKIPLMNQSSEAAILAQAAVAAGAVGIVIGQPPVGALPRNDRWPIATGETEPTVVRGSLYGPALFPQMFTLLLDLLQLDLGAAVIACGGIHTVAQAHQVLAAGAAALQIDSALWVEPGIAAEMVDAVMRSGSDA